MESNYGCSNGAVSDYGYQYFSALETEFVRAEDSGAKCTFMRTNCRQSNSFLSTFNWSPDVLRMLVYKFNLDLGDLRGLEATLTKCGVNKHVPLTAVDLECVRGKVNSVIVDALVGCMLCENNIALSDIPMLDYNHVYNPTLLMLKSVIGPDNLLKYLVVKERGSKQFYSNKCNPVDSSSVHCTQLFREPVCQSSVVDQPYSSVSKIVPSTNRTISPMADEMDRVSIAGAESQNRGFSSSVSPDLPYSSRSSHHSMSPSAPVFAFETSGVAPVREVTSRSRRKQRKKFNIRVHVDICEKALDASDVAALNEIWNRRCNGSSEASLWPKLALKKYELFKKLQSSVQEGESCTAVITNFAKHFHVVLYSDELLSHCFLVTLIFDCHHPGAFLTSCSSVSEEHAFSQFLEKLPQGSNRCLDSGKATVKKIYSCKYRKASIVPSDHPFINDKTFTFSSIRFSSLKLAFYYYAAMFTGDWGTAELVRKEGSCQKFESKIQSDNCWDLWIKLGAQRKLIELTEALCGQCSDVKSWLLSSSRSYILVLGSGLDLETGLLSVDAKEIDGATIFPGKNMIGSAFMVVRDNFLLNGGSLQDFADQQDPKQQTKSNRKMPSNKKTPRKPSNLPSSHPIVMKQECLENTTDSQPPLKSKGKKTKHRSPVRSLKKKKKKKTVDVTTEMPVAKESVVGKPEPAETMMCRMKTEPEPIGGLPESDLEEGELRE